MNDHRSLRMPRGVRGKIVGNEVARRILLVNGSFIISGYSSLRNAFPLTTVRTRRRGIYENFPPAISGERGGPVIVVKRVSLEYLARERSLTLMRHYYALESSFSAGCGCICVYVCVYVCVCKFTSPVSIRLRIHGWGKSRSLAIAITRSPLAPSPSNPAGSGGRSIAGNPSRRAS